jgi:hypothetical protein
VGCALKVGEEVAVGGEEGCEEIVGEEDTVGEVEGISLELVEGTSLGDTVANSASKRRGKG